MGCAWSSPSDEEEAPGDERQPQPVATDHNTSLFSLIEMTARGENEAAAPGARDAVLPALPQLQPPSIATFADIIDSPALGASALASSIGVAGTVSVLAGSMSLSRAGGNRSVHFDDAASGSGKRGSDVPRSRSTSTAPTTSGRSSLSITLSRHGSEGGSMTSVPAPVTPLTARLGVRRLMSARNAAPGEQSISMEAALGSTAWVAERNVAPANEPSSPFRPYARPRSLGGNPLLPPTPPLSRSPSTPSRFASRRVTHVDDSAGDQNQAM
jgi:hypothetical protein